MAQDSDFINIASTLVMEVNVAVRRGQINGLVAETLMSTLEDLGAVQNQPLHLSRTPVRFAVPSNFNLKSGATIMTVVNIHGDKGTKVPVEFDNLAGTAVPAPSGNATVTSSDPSVATVILDAAGSAVDIFPVQPPVTGKPFTVTYTEGSISFSQDFVVQPDLNATQGHFVTSDATELPLPTEAPSTGTTATAAP